METVNSIDNFEPHLDDRGTVVEGLEEYCNRIGNELSNIPKNVMGQWFYEHPDSYLRYDWLNYSRLRFNLEEFTIPELTLECFSKEPYVELFYENLNFGRADECTIKIETYVRENLTWPVPPIVLLNKKSRLSFPDSVLCDSPYHLLEGRHRFAVLLFLSASMKLAVSHKVWVAVSNQS